MQSAFLEKTMHLRQVCMKSIQMIESYVKLNYLLKIYRDKIAKLAPSHNRFKMTNSNKKVNFHVGATC